MPLADVRTAGIAGFTHGLYWYFPVPDEDKAVLSIPILEFLGVCFNILAYHDHLGKLGGGVRVLLRTDALTAARTLPEESMRSPLLVAAYQMLTECEEWHRLAPILSVQHIFGDCNPFSDLASRARWDEFRQLCRQFGIRPQEIQLPARCYAMYEHIVYMCRSRESHVSLDAAALEHGVANNGAGARQPFAHDALQPLSLCCGMIQYHFGIPVSQCSYLERCPTCPGDRCERCWTGEVGASGRACTCLFLPPDLGELLPDGVEDESDDEPDIQVPPTLPAPTADPQMPPAQRLRGGGPNGAYTAGAQSALDTLRASRGEVRCPATTSSASATGVAATPHLHVLGTQGSVSALEILRSCRETAMPMLGERRAAEAEGSRPHSAVERLVQARQGRASQPTGPSAGQGIGAGKRTASTADTMPTPPPERRRLAESPLAKASRLHMQARVEAMSRGGDDDMALRAEADVLSRVGDALEEMMEFGVNSNTLNKDERAWIMWEEVCADLGTSPLRTAAEVRNFPERNAHLLAVLLLRAFATCKPRDPKRHFIKPRSALAYPLAIIRIFSRWGVPMPSYKMLKSAVGGLSRTYLSYHGPYSLAPTRAEPMKFSMVRALNAIPDGARVGSLTWAHDNHDVFMFRRLNRLMIVTALRLGEVVRHSSGEIMYLTFESLVWSIGGVLIKSPTTAQFRSMRSGIDGARLAPPRSKPDQWGEIHCPFAMVLTYDESDPINAAAALRDGATRSAKRYLRTDARPRRSSRMETALRTAITSSTPC